MNPCTIILFGATGDLALRKILPAIHDLARFEKKDIRLIGISRDKVSVNALLEKARVFVRDCDDATWQKLGETTQYVCGDFSKKTTYAKIKALLADDADDRLVYLATGSEFFAPITAQLVEHDIIRRQEADEAQWHRVAYEKPFGHDLASAREIEAAIRQHLTEFQVYRVDHFLAKKALVAFPVARMLDETFNELWNHGNIASVQIIMNEQAGVGMRGAYYDKVGALRDMVQNHGLQALALLLVDSPVLDYPDLCSEKRKVLSRVSITDVVLGQYEGYLQEAHVAPDSRTETFVAARVAVDAPRWNEVLITLKTGKMLASQKLVIHVLIKSNAPERVADMPMAVVAFNDNSVVLVVGEEEIISALRADRGPAAAPRDSLDAYGRVLEFILQGDRTLFISPEEVVEMWRIVDAVESRHLPVHRYVPGSDGPKELQQFSQRNGVEWIL